jgi:SAM-dependent methyltransferase
MKKIDLLDEQEIPNVEAIHCLFEQYCSLRDFDTICMFHALEHVEDSIEVLKSVHNWLNESGTFYVSVPNAQSMHRRLGVFLGLSESVYSFSKSDYDKGHKRIYDLGSLTKELQQCGFDIIETRGSFVKVLPDEALVSSNVFGPRILAGLFEISKDVPPDLCAELILTCRKSKYV